MGTEVLQNWQIGTASNASDLYFDVAKFTSQPGHQLSWLVFFGGISHSLQTDSELVAQLGHDCFPPNMSKFIHYSAFQYNSLELLTASLNKQYKVSSWTVCKY